MSQNFVQKYLDIVKSKDTILCVGLDPALPSQREKDVMPTDDRVEFMRNIIKDVAPYTAVIKMNRQYLIGLSVDELRMLNILIHQNNMLSIIDHKLGDIGSSNDSAIFWFKEESFDAFTFSPFAGNIAQTVNSAHSLDLGVIVLTLMSNPEAVIQKQFTHEDKPLFLHIAEECKKHGADGIVVGATGHITNEDIKNIRLAVGDNVIVLVPGVGRQGGNAKTLIHYFGAKTMVNVGRAIIYADNPRKQAREYMQIFNEQRKESRRNFY